MLNVSFIINDLDKDDAIAVFVNDKLHIEQGIIDLDQLFYGVISKSIQDSNKFTGKFGQVMCLTGVNQEGKIKTIIVVGIGNEANLADYQIEQLGGIIYNNARSQKSLAVGVQIDTNITTSTQANIAALIASGAMLASYKFDKYLTKQTAEEKFSTEELNIIVPNPKEAEDAFASKKAVVSGVGFARDLVSEVPNVLYPEKYAEQIFTKLDPLGIDVSILGEREMADIGMGALLGVGQGSTHESKLVIMQYNGADSDQKPVCFVGKGVTFDTGGISLKPSTKMGDMKYDMGGSASVVGTMQTLAMREAKVNVVGIVGLVENMPGSNAQRPGDVVKTMSGQTVEVLNTDAEGRLVLCDCMTYLQENFDPACIIDLATLTGAIIVSLASTYAGLFANDDVTADQLIKSSLSVNEKLWRMPLHKDYDDMLKSPVADMANIGSEGGAAGSCTAAHFIERFVKKGVKWAHIDIAGMAWEKTSKNHICPKGAVGFGVKLLNQFVSDHYES
ncbi:MAG: leucyl aminopeptidase [Rickettsiaceae bacterium]